MILTSGIGKFHFVFFGGTVISQGRRTYMPSLAGTRDLKEQIIKGVSEEEIRKSWEPGLSTYKEMRKKCLLYP